MSVRKEPIKILFNVFANEDNPNAQSLNARDIALRLNPERFESTFFLSKGKKPDPRLIHLSNIHFVTLPPRLGSLVIAKEMLWGQQDILIYPELSNRASRIFWMLRKVGKNKKLIVNIEISEAQLQAMSEAEIRRYLGNIKKAGYCFAITQYISDSFKETYGIDNKVIPVGINLDIFKTVDRKMYGLPVKVLYVGSIQPRKQTHLIIETAKILKDMPVEFHIIGPVIRQPSYKQDLLSMKEREGLGNVHFHSEMVQEEVSEWMEKSDIFMLPSRLEGLPKVTLEAAATGLPCIVFDDYQTPSVIDGVTGFQVKTFEEMLERLKMLIENKELRMKMGAAAAEHAKKFDWDIIVKQWERVFEEAVTSGSQ
jgi:glycosyltransferase involved in cell wall biosynthesis